MPYPVSISDCSFKVIIPPKGTKILRLLIHVAMLFSKNSDSVYRPTK